MSNPPQVFICYAHLDKPFLDRLRMHLAPLEDEISVWSDQQLEMGDRWDDEIKSTLRSVKAAILLVSPAFLASKYIKNSELPVLLHRAQQDGVKILPVILSPCLFNEAKFKFPDPKTGPEQLSLSVFQAANSLKDPMSKLPEHEQDALFLKLAQRVIQISNGD
ncbi:toll/interleukin-1 receptor domain-containing protein [Oscillatoria sp. FACHB-1407]|uniref:toll/interleukin-1 receptor domain-containing protein n=1 Tax=Oscillatoria sp. FACHB-1407 TaxID=2692847 RepID=UPI00168A0A24|nr:toll/interleukin-1 receptor domain-containing protein [Oscillatoria sp. FACHB-1407]MBD2459835.1 toll/interleukin-1 receptor domain-containing protein [Oscillatoria sp. FACHB-1407]